MKIVAVRKNGWWLLTAMVRGEKMEFQCRTLPECCRLLVSALNEVAV